MLVRVCKCICYRWLELPVTLLVHAGAYAVPEYLVARPDGSNKCQEGVKVVIVAVSVTLKW